MNIKRLILAGLTVNVISFAIPVPSYFLFSWIFQLEPTNIWKWTPQISLTVMPINWLVFLFGINVILAILFVLPYTIFYKGIPGKGIRRGLVYALLLYPVGVLIPMFSIYVLLNISSIAVVYFALEGLVEFLAYGAVISVIYKEKEFAAT